MRLFAAVPLTEPARSELIRALSHLKSLEWPVRWVHEDDPHITLKFFGEVPDERFDVIEEALGLAVRNAPPLALGLSGLGAFPTERRPRVLWAGIESNAAFAALRERIEAACVAIGFAPEGTPFQPHVTLGRMREGQRLPPGALESQSNLVTPMNFAAPSMLLYESVLTSTGPRYTVRSTFEFGRPWAA